MISIVVLTMNRLESLKRCIKSIEENTTMPYEIIVVDNASSDGTGVWILSKVRDSILSDKCNFTGIYNQENEGVIARNKGFRIAKGDILLQVDDDVIVHPSWDTTVLEPFNDPKVGCVGVQGGIIHEWLSMNVWESNNGYVDFLTGYCYALRNIGVYYDERFGRLWHEELWLTLKFKELGYKLRVVPMVCTHASQRTGEVEWCLHDRNLKYVYDKWKDNLEILRLGGN